MPDSLLYFVGLSALIKYTVYYKSSKPQKPKAPPKEKIYAGTVKELAFFPLKSARGLDVKNIEVVDTGFQYGILGDRGLAVMTPKGHAITAMREPTMTTLDTRIVDNGNVVEVETPGQEILRIDLIQVEKTGKQFMAKFMGTEAEVYDCGEEAAEWISTFLDKAGQRIVFCGQNLKRRTSKECIASNAKLLHMEFSKEFLETIPEIELTLTNSSPVSVVSQNSIEDVDTRLARPIGSERYRTNIIVDSVLPPYDEDTWDEVFIGDNVQFKFVRLCGRCSIVDTDPEVGVKEKGPAAPINCMKEWRALFKTDRASYVFLCIHCAVLKTGKINVGDKIYVTRQANREAVSLKE